MEKIISLLIIIPFIGFLLSIGIPKKEEKPLFWIVTTTILTHFLGFVLLIFHWFKNGSNPIHLDILEVYQNNNFRFVIELYFDKISAVYLGTGAVITYLVAIFSRFYLHRDPGFKRFFATLLLFYIALNFIVLSGNFETLFIGWEIMGITSFLLIAFYRDRFLPVKNALKVLSIYRLGDMSLLLSMWLLHHLFEKNISFVAFNDSDLIREKIHENYILYFTIGLLFFLAAAVKSAQIPFSSWLPRAMEGPTTSSAIFYGSLSVHLGIFLLLRTYPFWSENILLQAAVFLMGLITSLIANSISNVQSTVKTQIAYSSITQIGIIFMEVALGWHTLALVHFVGNAFLRTYQLLVSPSVLGYMIHDQFFSYTPKNKSNDGSFVQKVRNTIYMLSIKEWNLDFFQFRYLWTPFKWLGIRFAFLSQKMIISLLFAMLLLGVVARVVAPESLEMLSHNLSSFFAFIAMSLVLNTFASRQEALTTWINIFLAQCFIALAISMKMSVELHQILYFLSGSTICFSVGYICLSQMYRLENNIDLNNFHGHAYEHSTTSNWFLVAVLGLVGLPLTPTFLGIDLFFTSIHIDEYLLITLLSIAFLFLEIAAFRIYIRVFLGQHNKKYHEIAFKSS